MLKKIFYAKFLMIFLAGALTLPALAQRGPGAKGPIDVIVAPVQLQKFADRIEALGTTKANETVAITADTSEKISEIHFEDGQTVKQGDLLVTLDKSQEDAELRAVKAELSEATAAYNRAKELQGTRAISKATLDERLAALRQSEAAVEVIEARMDELAITAPFDGILGLREVSVGTLVQPGDRITTIDDLTQIKVDFDVPSVFLSTLQPGLPIVGTVDAFGERQFKGSVRIVNTQVDPVTRTVRVRAVLPNADLALKPGLLMTITLFKNPRDALLIPEEALIKRGEKNYVFVIGQKDGQSVAQETEIQIGARQPGVIEVLSGLNVDDQVVAHGTVKVGDGAAVNVSAVEAQDAPLEELLKQKQAQPSPQQAEEAQ